jgi:hypothetical protein
MAVIQTKKEDTKYDYLKKVYTGKNKDKVKASKSKPEDKVVVKQQESLKIAKKDWMTMLLVFLVMGVLSVSGYVISKYLNW